MKTPHGMAGLEKKKRHYTYDISPILLSSDSSDTESSVFLQRSGSTASTSINSITAAAAKKANVVKRQQTKLIQGPQKKQTPKNCHKAGWYCIILF
jgi:hypothetical protein